MPILKTIHINPELLSVNSNKTRKNKKKKERLIKKAKIIQPNTLKKALLRRIKEKSQQENNAKLITNPTLDFSSDFENIWIIYQT